MTDFKEYAKQMRENAVKNEQGNIVCSPELWEEIASVVERAIVPPCKVGDMVYNICTIFDESTLKPKTIIKPRIIDFVSKVGFIIESKGLVIGEKDFDNTIFLTKEEAEAELRKRSNDNA